MIAQARHTVKSPQISIDQNQSSWPFLMLQLTIINSKVTPKHVAVKPCDKLIHVHHLTRSVKVHIKYNNSLYNNPGEAENWTNELNTWELCRPTCCFRILWSSRDEWLHWSKMNNDFTHIWITKDQMIAYKNNWSNYFKRQNCGKGFGEIPKNRESKCVDGVTWWTLHHRSNAMGDIEQPNEPLCWSCSMAVSYTSSS